MRKNALDMFHYKILCSLFTFDSRPNSKTTSFFKKGTKSKVQPSGHRQLLQ